MNKGKGKRDIGREAKMVARLIAKPKTFSTTYGNIYLNPLKRHLKNKPYKNSEFNEILNQEVKTTIEMLKGGNK